MRMIALIARGKLTYQGRRIAAGEVFEAAPVDAAVLRYQRQVDFAPRGTAPVPPPDLPPLITRGAPTPDPPDPDTTSANAANDGPEPSEEPEEEKPRRRRSYRRRDLEPED